MSKAFEGETMTCYVTYEGNMTLLNHCIPFNETCINQTCVPSALGGFSQFVFEVGLIVLLALLAWYVYDKIRERVK